MQNNSSPLQPAEHAAPAPSRLSEEELFKMRHSCAHLMAAAVQQLWPTAKFGVGPALEKGFYYDIMLDHSLTMEDLARIEQVMNQLRKKGLRFTREEKNIDEALRYMQEHDQPFKVELLKLLKEKGSTAVSEETGDAGVAADTGAGVDTVSFYTVGNFVDLCRGPHIENTKQIGVYKLMNIAGAYWRGNSDNPQLQRIYGYCFETKEDLDNAIWQAEEAKKRDHRKLGRELELFRFSDEVGSGLPLWLPKGTVIKEELEFLAKSTERKAGYQRVSTPQLTKGALYERSGHLPYYADDMYAPIEIDDDKYYLRPMNCPHHHEVYLARPRSYRELPVRLAEYGQVYRYEASGALSGLMRTRGFCQNDAHIYCTYEQAEGEFLKVMHMHADYYRLFDIKDFYMRLSLPDLDKLDKYVKEPDEWRKAVEIIQSAMRKSGYPFKEVKGEAAFYGPKVDFMIKSVIGTEYAISTNQLDFLASKRFNLVYTAEDASDAPLYVIHRAPLGSHERFVAFLLEHYGANFPTWLAPVQAKIIPISDNHLDYAREVQELLTTTDVPLASGVIRSEIDQTKERMQKKILFAQQNKIPYMLIVGDKEKETRTVSVRKRGGADLGAIPLTEFAERVRKECADRRDIA